ncbi:hypothetical protein HK104_005010, partial [Borealophlyctis nickersoniae]
MGGQLPSLTEDQISWIQKQHLFFVATAPPDAKSLVNVSPKGMASATLTVENGNRIWYQDMLGSGIETIAHIRTTPRITLLFLELTSAAPKIIRCFGKATVHLRDSPTYNTYLPPNSPSRIPGSRSVIVIDIDLVTYSCGFSIPIYEFVKSRDTLLEHGAKIEAREGDGFGEFLCKKNARSLDGLVGLEK